MQTARYSLLIAACDAYLAGAFARRFERDGWDVRVVDSVKDAQYVMVQMRPSVFLLEAACTPDPAAEVRRLRSLPTLRGTKIVVLAHDAHTTAVHAALNAGADDYLLVGHVMPSEVVAKMKILVGV